MAPLATLDDIAQEVLGNQNFDSTAMQARIYRYIDEGQKKICRRVDLQDLRKVSTINTVSATRTITAPTDLLRIISLTDISNSRWLRPARGNLIDVQPTSTGVPIYYSYDADGIVLYPTPDGVYSLKMRYQGLPATLSIAADVPVIPNDYFHVLVSYASWKAYRAENDYQAADVLYKDFDRELRELGSDRRYVVKDGPRQVQGAYTSQEPW